MAITDNARKALNVTMVAHPGQADGTLTETGLIKTAKGLVIRPSTQSAQTMKTGPLARLTESERSAYRILENSPETVKNVVETQSKKGKRKRQEVKDDAVSAPVTVVVTIPGIGDVPTQYARLCRGPNCIVLGLTPMSYVPAECELKADGPSNKVKFSVDRSSYYVNSSYEFIDEHGTRNLVMIKVPQEALDDNAEETTYDGEEQ